MNTNYVGGQTTKYGEFKPVVLSGNGPASYAITGDVIYNPGSGEYLNAVSPCATQSGNYTLIPFPTTAGVVRAGSPSPSQSGFTFLWTYSGKQGVATLAINVQGTGMTPGTYPLVATGGGGSGFAGTLTVTGATASTVVINNSGAGYTSAPTITPPATGGTPPTFTVTVAPGSGVVAPATNLSAEVVQFGAIISAL